MSYEMDDRLGEILCHTPPDPFGARSEAQKIAARMRHWPLKSGLTVSIFTWWLVFRRTCCCCAKKIRKGDRTLEMAELERLRSRALIYTLQYAPEPVKEAVKATVKAKFEGDSEGDDEEAKQAVKAKIEDKKRDAVEIRDSLEVTLRDLSGTNKKLSNVLQKFGWTKSTTGGVETWHFEMWPNPRLKYLLSELEEDFGGMLAASEICMDTQRRTQRANAEAEAGKEHLSIEDSLQALNDNSAMDAEKQAAEVQEEEASPVLWLDAVLEELNKNSAERDSMRCAELCRNLAFFQRLGVEEGAQILGAAQPRRLDTACATLFKRRVYMPDESADADRKDTKNFTGFDEIFVLLNGTAELHFQPAVPAEGTGTGTSWPAIKSTFRPGDPISFSDNRLQELLVETLADTHGTLEIEKIMPGGVKEWNAVVLSLEPCWLLQIDPTEYMRVVKNSVGERDLADQVALLRRIPLFHSVTDVQLKDIATRLTVERYHYGDVVVQPGVATPGLYVLWQGNANIVLPQDNDDLSRDALNQCPVLFKLSSSAYCGFGAIKDPPEKPQMALIVTSSKADFFLLPKKGLEKVFDVSEHAGKKQKKQKMQSGLSKAVDPLSPTEEMLARAKTSMGQWRFYRRRLLERTVDHPDKMADTPTQFLGAVPPPSPERKTALTLLTRS